MTPTRKVTASLKLLTKEPSVLAQSLLTCKQGASSDSEYASCVANVLSSFSTVAQEVQNRLSELGSQVSHSCANQIVTLSGPLSGWSQMLNQLAGQYQGQGGLAGDYAAAGMIQTGAGYLTQGVHQARAACGGSPNGSTGGSTTKPGAVPPSPGTSAAADGSVDFPVSSIGEIEFHMPSRNIGCDYFDGTLRCDIGSGMHPTPSGTCSGYARWAGEQMTRTGVARAVCAEDGVFNVGAAFPYGSVWRHGGFACTSRMAGLQCTNSSGRGFFLSRAITKTF
jgi:hypothetical protein